MDNREIRQEKKYLIENAEKIKVLSRADKMQKSAIAQGGEEMKVSDGYHTMDELYEHRIQLFLALCRQAAWGEKDHSFEVWRSRRHSNKTDYPGWFVMGINKEMGKQITYHIPNELWDQTEFAETLEFAPDFDGHTSQMVLERLKLL